MVFRVFALALILVACNNSVKDFRYASISKDSMLALLASRANDYQIRDELDSLGYFLDSIEPAVTRNYDESVKLLWAINKLQQVRRQEMVDSQNYFLQLTSRLAKSPVITKRQLVNFYVIYANELKSKNLTDSVIKIENEARSLSVQIDSFRYAEICTDLARLYMQVSDPANGRKYMFEAWRCRAKEPEQTPYIADVIATYYDETGQIDSALQFASLFEKDSSLLWNTELREWGYECKAYFLKQKGKYNEGVNYLIRAKELNDKLHKNNGTLFFDLSDLYLQSSKFGDAHRYVDSALVAARKKFNLPLVKEAWKAKGALFERQGNFKDAYKALDSAYVSYKTEMDSSLRNFARELETKYAVREKDAAIKSLATANLANEKVRRLQQITIIALIVAAILATVIGVLLWKRRQVQMRVREVDLRTQVLRAQMEPHFLFNMLSVLQARIRSNDKERSDIMLTKFSRLLRSILENARKRFVLLADEVSVLESYLALQAMVKEDKFDYTIEVDPDLQRDRILIPPMILQPFAENAIQHGFHNLDHKGKLVISVDKGNGSIVCTIDDNGRGMQPATNGDGRYHASEITSERLVILSKQTHSRTKLNMIDKASVNEGQGVRVEIELPVMTGDAV